MAENNTPHQILKELVHGGVPSRPLFLPIVFALGARIENLSLRAFLANPTKISNSLRQTRPHLRSDGVSCYFDPLLEAEALGGTLEWRSDNEPATLRWPSTPEPGQLPNGLRSPEEMLKCGRMPVALEVIRRLKALLRDEFLLTAGVSGPFALAARLAGVQGHNSDASVDLPDAALEAATSAVAQASKAFAEAGANLIFLHEERLPAKSVGRSQDWESMLRPIFNVIRFYEAQPVLQVADEHGLAENSEAILRLAPGCVVCLPLEAIQSLLTEKYSSMRSAKLGIGLPAAAFQPDQPSDASFVSRLAQLISDVQPAIVTTASDVPAATDLKRLAAISEIVRR
jgi:uroporphyrinogen decarboxylase-like protein